MLVGIDWGGTKIEIIALADDGAVLLRERIVTPKNDYAVSYTHLTLPTIYPV